MTYEGRKKLFLSDPKRFAAYADEFKDLIKEEPKEKPKPKPKKEDKE